jgi:hypothetical protein
MGAFAVQLALAVAESLIMAVLKRFIPILRGALPPDDGDSRHDAIERNRFFVAAFFQYLVVIIVIAMTFAALPYINQFIAAPGRKPQVSASKLPTAAQQEFTNPRDAKHVGKHLPDMKIPGKFTSPAVWRASMLALVPIMVITGIVFWPVWKIATALGYDDPVNRKRLHAQSAISSMCVGIWLILYLFTPLSLKAALATFAGIVGVLYVLSIVTGRQR